MSFNDLAADEEMAIASGRKKREDDLEARVAAWTSQQDDQFIQDKLIAAGVAAYVVQDGAQCMEDIQNISRGHFIKAEQTSAGELTLENSRFRLSRTPAIISKAGPDQGEHNYEVLSEVLGYDSERIADIYASLAME